MILQSCKHSSRIFDATARHCLFSAMVCRTIKGETEGSLERR